MQTAEAAELIREAVSGRMGLWADLGAGEGTFTRGLVELLGPGTRIYAVERDARALKALARRAGALGVVPVAADFTRPFELPGLGDGKLDGLLLANSLHFVADPGPVLARLVEEWLRPGGRLVVVEYDRRRPSRWVPYPITMAAWPTLAVSAGLVRPVITATRPSAFVGDLYVGAADRPAD